MLGAPYCIPLSLDSHQPRKLQHCRCARLRLQAATCLQHSQPPPACASAPADSVVSVRENEVALAACGDPGWIITSVDNAMYGDVANRCNSSLTYT